ncbi:MAG TPA: alpha-glucan family phosphorylase [Thermoanaerobaculia bacterium]
MTPVLEKALRVSGVSESLLPLFALSHDLRWTWRAELRSLFEILDPEAWRRVHGNPVALFREASAERLRLAAEDAGYQSLLAEATRRLAEEDAAVPSHPAARELASRGERIAYFSAEFGLTEVLPIYAGGLGVLAGDHLKSSSDLGLPLVGVGLFYREGYFRQLLDPERRQAEIYPQLDPEDLPLSVAETPDATPPLVTVDLAGRTVRLLIRFARVGRVPLLLLDSNVEGNEPADRDVTARLYGGGHEMRLQQEIVLGIGGSRALEKVGLWPTIRHINEGHAAFVSLEKIRHLMQEEGLSFAEAREVAAAGNVFTTHTPVPAGIDVFTPELLSKYFGGYVGGLGLTFDEFFDLGREVGPEPGGLFSMAVLAMRLSTHQNAVSRLHAKVSRRLWRGLAPDLPLSELPIDPITNGVHGPTWTAPEIAATGISEWPEAVDRRSLWRRHEELRARLVAVCRERLIEAKRRQGARDEDVEEAGRALDPQALTIGFARRFTTYKRATLLFKDPKRLEYLLHQIDRPVQILFAGKAHPRDEAGKEFLGMVARAAEAPEYRGRIVFLPDYDMALARALVSGCDVWLNTPERPREASGTSGMKAATNGVLNLSVLDGWWDEAPHAEAGFSVGEPRDHAPDDEIVRSLFEVLEQRVLPLFFDRDAAGLPQRWIDRMIVAGSTLARMFSSDRMVSEYLEQCYLPGALRRLALKDDDRMPLKRLVAWKQRLASAWPDVRFDGVTILPDPAAIPPGAAFEVTARACLSTLDPSEVSVELFEGPLEEDGSLESGVAVRLEPVGRDGESTMFRGSHRKPAGENMGFAIRLRPFHPDLAHANETGRMRWSSDRSRAGTRYAPLE